MKQNSVISLVLVFLGLFTIGCNNNSSNQTKTDKISYFDITTVKIVINEKNNLFAKAHLTGQKDSLVVINYYTQDAKVFPPNSDAVIGIPAIAEMVSLYMKFEIQELRIESTVIYGNEDFMIDEGNILCAMEKTIV